MMDMQENQRLFLYLITEDEESAPVVAAKAQLLWLLPSRTHFIVYTNENVSSFT
jgi:hypothetical protein